MFTLSEENYLKAIYHLELDTGKGVSTNAIAKKLETKASSVSDMIKKLSEKDVVVYKKYKGVTLTVFGKKIAGIGLILTRKCNMTCAYCGIIKHKKKELNIVQWKTIIDKFISFGHRHFIFTGGEPFLYKGLWELIKYTYPKTLISVITNTSPFSSLSLQ